MKRVVTFAAAWKIITRLLAITQVVFICSCNPDAYDHKEFIFRSAHPARSIEYATLIVKRITSPEKKLGLPVYGYIVSVYSVDGKTIDDAGSSLGSSFGPLQRVSHCSFDCVIFLRPGNHSIEVNYHSGTAHGAQNLFAGFVAESGKQYVLTVRIEGPFWTPSITEVNN